MGNILPTLESMGMVLNTAKAQALAVEIDAVKLVVDDEMTMQEYTDICAVYPRLRDASMSLGHAIRQERDRIERNTQRRSEDVAEHQGISRPGEEPGAERSRSSNAEADADVAEVQPRHSAIRPSPGNRI